MRTLCSLTLICAVVSGQQIPGGYTRYDLKIEPGITAPLAGDFTGDGVPDLVVHMASDIRVYPGNGKGAFGAPLSTPLGLTESRRLIHAAATGDFNADGKLDLFAFGRVYLGNGDGTLRFSVNVTVQDRPQVADVIRNGILDLAGMGNNHFTLYLGSADGRLVDPAFPYGDEWFDVSDVSMGAVADLNRDGYLDWLTYRPGSIQTYLQNPDLRISPSGKSTTGVLGGAIAIADLTGDGIPDILTGGRGDGPKDLFGPLLLYKGHGDGTFDEGKSAASLPGYFDSYSDFLVADLDRDGLQDIAFTWVDDDRGQTLLGIRTGVDDPFYQANSLSQLPAPSASNEPISVGDLNSDGFPELITTDNKSIMLFVAETLAVSSASGTSVVAPGSLATIYGLGLSDVTAVAPSMSTLPTTLAGVQLLVENSTSRDLDYVAELLYVSPTQINFRIRSDPAYQSETAKVRITTSKGSVNAGSVRVEASASALFTVDGNRALADVAAVSNLLQLTLYGTGLQKDASTGNVQLRLNGKLYTPESVTGLPGAQGVDVLRVVVPRQGCTDTTCSRVEWKDVVVHHRGTLSNAVAVSEEIH